MYQDEQRVNLIAEMTAAMHVEAKDADAETVAAKYIAAQAARLTDPSCQQVHLNVKHAVEQTISHDQIRWAATLANITPVALGQEMRKEVVLSMMEDARDDVATAVETHEQWERYICSCIEDAQRRADTDDKTELLRKALQAANLSESAAEPAEPGRPAGRSYVRAETNSTRRSRRHRATGR